MLLHGGRKKKFGNPYVWILIIVQHAKVKKKVSEREKIYETGGGKAEFPNITFDDENMKAIIEIAVKGLNNYFDNDELGNKTF